MVAYSTQNTLGANLQAVWTAGSGYTAYSDYPPFKAGQTTQGTDGTIWQYCKFAAAATQYDCVGIDESSNAASMTKALADASYKVGWVQVAITAADSYAWVALSGAQISGRILASSTSDSPLWTTTTAGVLGTTSASQTKIGGVVAIASSTTTTAQGLLADFPSVVRPLG